MTVDHDRGTGRTPDFAEIVAGVLEVDPAEVTDPADQETLSAWTSLRHLQLVVTLEEAYGVSFSYREIKDVRTIGQLRALLRTRGVGV